MMFKNRFRSIIAACLIGAGLTSLAHEPLLAHGTVTSPESRVYQCYLEGPENPSSAACKAATALGKQSFYDWNGVRQGSANDNHESVIPDGQLCSGGNGGGLDLNRTDWPATNISEGNNTFTWTNTAAHSTLYYRYFITRDGHDLTQPLRFSDLELFCDTGSSGAESTAIHTCNVPSRQGKHIIYSIWQRGDSPEAFYACVDVDFSNGAGSITPPAPAPTPAPTPTPTPPPVTPPSPGTGGSACMGLREWRSESVYVKGDQARLGDIRYEAKWWSRGSNPVTNSNSYDAWANQGACTGSTVTPPAVVDPDTGGGDNTPPPAPTPPPAITPPSSGNACTGLREWRSESVYVKGDQARAGDMRYEAKWWSQGSDPAQNSNPYDAWANKGACAGATVTPPVDPDTGGGDNTPPPPVTPSPDTGGSACTGLREWRSESVYVKGDQARVGDIRYEAKWWSRGKNPTQNSAPYDPWANKGAC